MNVKNMVKFTDRLSDATAKLSAARNQALVVARDCPDLWIQKQIFNTILSLNRCEYDLAELVETMRSDQKVRQSSHGA